MSRRVKSKTVRATLQNPDILDMFHGVLGGGDDHGVNIGVAYPKYVRIRQHTDRYVRLLEVLRDSQVVKKFPAVLKMLTESTQMSRSQFEATFTAPDLGPYLSPPGGGAPTPPPKEMVDQFGDVFARAKKCETVNSAVVTCKNLTIHKRQIENSEKLQDRFMTKTAGMSFAPFEHLPDLNIKQIYIDDRLTPDEKHFIMIVLHKAYHITHDIYEASSSPDIDVNEFVDVISGSIGEVRKHIPRCDAAFDRIAESVDLLRGNFDGYYRDFVASNNPMVIMENYVLDVKDSVKATPVLTGQFRQIVAHYRKLARSQSQDPKMKALFDQFDKNYQELEKDDQKAAKEGPEEDSEDESSDEEYISPEASSGGSSSGSSGAGGSSSSSSSAGDSGGLAEELDRQDALDP